MLVHLNIASELEREDPREFEELVLSAGGDPVAYVMGARVAPHPRTFVGSGKLAEIGELIEAGSIRLVIDMVFPFDQAKEALAYLANGRAEAKVSCK